MMRDNDNNKTINFGENERESAENKYHMYGEHG